MSLVEESPSTVMQWKDSALHGTIFKFDKENKREGNSSPMLLCTVDGADEHLAKSRGLNVGIGRNHGKHRGHVRVDHARAFRDARDVHLATVERHRAARNLHQGVKEREKITTGSAIKIFFQRLVPWDRYRWS